MIEVVAIIRGRSGTRDGIVDAFRSIADDVHAEPGCELYAVHTEDGTDTIVMVERWASRAALDAHASGEPLRRLNAAIGELLDAPTEVMSLTAVPMGEPSKGSIPA